MEAFLKKYITTSKPFTHTSILNPTGCFNIPEDKLDKFYALYEEQINVGLKMYFTECNMENASPIKLDIDLKCIKTRSKGRLYKSVNYKKLIEVYRNILLEVCDVDLNEKFLVIILEKEASNVKDETTKDGFHLVFPNTVVPFDVQFYIRRKLLEPANFNAIFEQAIYEN